MIVVADTSAISNLITVGKVGILGAFFGEVRIPPAVERELLAWHSALPPFISVLRPNDQEAVSRLTAELDPGEAEAIILARELHADLLLVDEQKGRLAASRFGLKSTGLLGVLLEAKGAGLLDCLKPVFDVLTDRAGFRVSGAVKTEFLKLAGES